MSVLVLCLWLQAAAASQGSVEGVVLNALTKEPLRKVEVEFTSSRPGSRGGYAMVTDAQGRFSATGLEPGDYMATATRTGFLPGPKAAGSVRTGMSVRVVAGQTSRNIEILLTPQAVIAGRVLDEDGDPMQHVQVSVMQAKTVRGRRQAVRVMNAATNDKGEFRVANLPPGKYVLAAEAVRSIPVEPPEGVKGPETGYAITFFPGVSDAFQAAPIEVQAAQEMAGVEIMLRRTPVFRVRGRVMESGTGQMADRAYVFLVPRDERGGSASPGRQWGASRMAQGNFEITGVPPGSYLLIAQRQDQNERMRAAVPLDIGGANVDGLVVNLQAGAALPGRIVVEGVPNAAPKDVRVNLTPSDGFGSAPPANTETKEDGSFVLRNVLPGRYRVMVWGEGLRDLYVSAVRHNEQDVTYQDLDVGSGAPGSLTVVLRGDGGSVSGSVRQDDQPAPGGAILLMPADEAKRGSNTVRVAPVGSNGAFSAKNLKPGDYVAMAVESPDDASWDDPDWVKTHQGEMIKVSIAPNGSANLRLTIGPAQAQ